MKNWITLVVAVVTVALPRVAAADAHSMHFGWAYPEGLSGGVSWVGDGQPPASSDDWFNFGGAEGLLVQGTVGEGGARFSMGKGCVGFGLIGAAVKGTVLTTWNDSYIRRGNATYLGAEGQASFLGRVSFGVFKRVSGPRGTRSVLVTASVGVGF